MSSRNSMGTAFGVVNIHTALTHRVADQTSLIRTAVPSVDRAAETLETVLAA